MIAKSNITPGFYWVRRKRARKLTIAQVVENHGDIWIELIGVGNAVSIELAQRIYKFLDRIAEPER